MKEVAIGLLGGFRISYDNSPITWVRSPRQEALLTRLLLHSGDPLPRTRLASLFWPDVDDVQARNNLRKLLHDLRDAWPDLESFVDVSRHGLTWRRAAEYWLDVDAFSEATAAAETIPAISQAVSLYAGELLPECYDDWILPYRARLQASFLDLLQRGVEVAEAERDYRGAIGHVQRLLREEPLREDFHLSFMRLHAVSGDRVGAVRAYHSCASVLKEELGVEPGVETQQLYHRLLDQERPEIAGDTQPDSEPGRIVLVGRNKEWQTMQQVWRATLEGHASVIMMTGDPGVGKTRLAEELQYWAGRQGLSVARSSAYESEQGLPFGVIAQLLRRQRTASRLSSLDSLWARELSRFLPELMNDYADLGDPGPLKESWQRWRLFEAIAHALLAIQPLILIVDDLQWCDSDSLLALEHLLRFDPAARILLLPTVRLGSGEEDAAIRDPAPDRLGRWVPGQGSVAIDLPRLDRHQTAQLATELDQGLSNALTDPDSIEALYRETEGNPLFIVELVRSGWEAANAPSHLPHTLEAAVRSRFIRLPDDIREVLDAAATLGTAFSVDVAGQVARQDEADLVRAIDYLWRRRIIQEQRSGAADPRYEFSHGQIREVAYGDLSPVKRLMLHRRAAEAYKRATEGTGHVAAGEIARHLELAGDFAQAGQFHVLAGEAARQIYANDAAVSHYHRALELLDAPHRLEVWLLLGETLLMSGSWSEAERTYREALALAASLGEDDSHAKALAGLGAVLQAVGRYEEALRCLGQARAECEARGDRASLCTVLWHLSAVYMRTGDGQKMLAHVEEEVPVASELGDPQQLLRAINLRGASLLARGELELALQDLERARGMAKASEDLGALSFALRNMGSGYRYQGNLTKALACHEEALRIVEQMGHRQAVAHIIGNMGLVHLDLGDYAKALDYYVRGMRVATEIGDQAAVVISLINIGDAYRRTGRHAAALACHGRAGRNAADIEFRSGVSFALGHLGLTYLATRDNAAADRILMRAVQMLDSVGNDHEAWPVLLAAAELALKQEDFAVARRLNQRAARSVEGVQVQGAQPAVAVQTVRLDVALAEQTVEAAVQQLEEYFADHQEERQQALFHYAIWRLDPSQEEHRAAAAGLYGDLCRRIPDFEYRRRYHELTGGCPPDGPPPPDVLDELGLEPFDLAELLAYIDVRLEAAPAAAG